VKDGNETAATRYAWLVLGVTFLGMLVVFASTTSVNVALPAISKDLDSEAGVADWHLLSNMLSNTVLILMFGRISDLDCRPGRVPRVWRRG
jgi:MFS family permease